MHRPSRFASATVALAAVALAGCGAGTAATSGSSATTASAPGAKASGASTATVEVRTTSDGRVLTTSTGKVIYLLTADRPGSRACTGSCLRYWPPVMVHGTPTAASGVTARLGELPLAGGQQLTVDGHPAYTFVGDSGPGTTSGEGVHSFGGIWWVLSPAGTAVTSAASTSTTTSGSGGYGGY
jgi:predicted lipoprotein with Yx(FWY)xxD motif